MDKKTKIILFSIIGVALVLFFLAFIISSNQKYKITFDTDGGSYIQSQEIKKGDIVTKPIDPTKDGYEFIQWNYENEEYDFLTKVKKDMTLVAIWEELAEVYKVTFEIEGNKESIEVKDGETIDLSKLSSLEKVGYEIKWYNGEEEIDLETFKVNSDLDLTGKYVEVKTYIVTFNSNGGSKVDKQIVNENKLVKEPIEPTKEGYVFDAWYLNNQEYDFNTPITSNLILTAKWIEDTNVKRYEVKFNTYGGSNITSQRVIEGKKVTKPKDPTKNGYKFEGWYLNNQKYDFNKTVTEDITLTAKWRELEKYTVSFNTDSGSNVPSQTITEGGKVTKPTNPTKKGYTFKEWELNGKTYDFNSIVTGNITLKAVYEKDKEKYTVTFNTDGGSKVSNQIVVEGGKVVKPTNPTKTGYKFKEWELNGKTYDFNSLVTRNITLKAVWEELSKYTVTFNTNGGSNVPNQKVTEGGKVTKPNNPTRNGYTFKEWQLNGKNYDFNSLVTGNITLKAVWEEIIYTITAKPVDKYSVDVTLTVMNGSKEVTNIRSINYSDGVFMCSGSLPIISMSEYEKQTSFIVVLSDGTQIKAVK